MKSLRLILAMVLLLPLAAGAAALTSQDAQSSVIQEIGSAPFPPTTEGYDCCWIWVGGAWRCYPC